MNHPQLALAAAAPLVLAAVASAQVPQLSLLGTYDTGTFDGSAQEIAAFDAATARLFVTNADSGLIEVLDLSDPSTPTQIATLPALAGGGSPNSVAVSGGLVAVAVELDGRGGRVDFFDAATLSLTNSVGVGPLPDSLTFTPDGTRVVVANEGQPIEDSNGDDPVGSVSVIDLDRANGTAQVRTIGFAAFDGTEAALRANGVRIAPGRSASADFEPEYAAVSPDSSTAYVTLQENNAVAVIDLDAGSVTDVLPLGVIDRSQVGFDPSNRDGGVNIATFDNVFGLRQPDAVATYGAGGRTFFVTANEGDSREYEFADGSEFVDEARVKDLTLDPTAFPNAAALQADAALGRLLVSTSDGDLDGDGDFDRLFNFGGRSFTIFDDAGQVVFDSGEDFERITAAALPGAFNSNNDDNDSFDARSDDKGPEPEGLAIGSVGDVTFAFVGLERVGGVMVYDVTDPANPAFVQYLNNRDFSEDAELTDGVSNPAAGDLGPEGILFIDAADSPIGVPLLVVTNEVSGSTSVYSFAVVPEPATAGVVVAAGWMLRRRRA